ncbi:LOW QUALITY PROTEIN: desmethyl-deoxy-podophyllotoxin synthase-like [Argentina anserina]|uniref:LOW QUALITY PROTEIN: desmethyl-deoxy-podophyllotoxin synthase-like n=1 Tax=Argentina anserina TaxID=57926 RepID=UPI0021765431|nr:LOW QUALITY PROTEIN: desmethyl-deoxy-podophyllotoxin synthase-like [Potentilla anserina]
MPKRKKGEERIECYICSGIISSPCNDYWREMRKLCVLELLSAKRVQSFVPLREEETWNLVEKITNDLLEQPQGHYSPPINLSGMIFSTVTNIAARAAFGKRCKHEQEFTSLINEISKLAAGFDVLDLFPSLEFLHHLSRKKSALEIIHQKMDKIFDEIINEHKLVMKRKGSTILAETTSFPTISSEDSKDQLQQEDQDLVDVLLQLQESGDLNFQLTTNHVKAVTLDMYSAETETSATTIEWAMSELLKNPRVMEKAQFEVRQLLAGKRKIQEADIKKLDYLKLVIRETLRLHPPLALIPRQANEKCRVSGYDIPIGAKVLVNAWAIGRDPKHWGADADCFRPERFQGSSIDFRGANFELLPFGAGKRMCPGISFGIAVIELALSQLLYFFNWKLPNGTNPQDLDMTESEGLASRRRNELKVTAVHSFLPITTTV